MNNVQDVIKANRLIKIYEYNTILSPEHWKSISDLPHYDWNIIEFDSTNTNNIPRKPGIYSFIINPRVASHPNKFLGYIGKTERTLQERFKEYINEQSNPKGRPKVVWMLNNWQNYIDFCYIETINSDKIEEIESRLNDAFLPPYNSDFTAEVNRGIAPFK